MKEVYGKLLFCNPIKSIITAGQLWCHTSLIPEIWKQRQADLCDFKASLVYRASSRTDSIATEKPCLEKQQNPKQIMYICMYIHTYRQTDTPIIKTKSVHRLSSDLNI